MSLAWGLVDCLQRINYCATSKKFIFLQYSQLLLLQYGLYSAFVGCFVYCFFGTSKDIQLGPTAIMSFLTAIFAGQC